MGCEPTGPHTGLGQAPFLLFFLFFSFFFPRTSSVYIIYVSSIALLKCVWRRLTARFMRLGGWKGVEHLASPCRLKNIAATIIPFYHRPTLVGYNIHDDELVNPLSLLE
jgi:hypothetical protein